MANQRSEVDPIDVAQVAFMMAEKYAEVDVKPADSVAGTLMVCGWATEFEEIHRDTDWGEMDETFFESVDNYFWEKYHEYRNSFRLFRDAPIRYRVRYLQGLQSDRLTATYEREEHVLNVKAPTALQAIDDARKYLGGRCRILGASIVEHRV